MTDIFDREKMILMFTYQCNCNCIYCPINKDEKKQMAIELAFRAVDLFAEYCQKKNVKGIIKIFGGEPLIFYNHLKNLIRYIGDKKDFLEGLEITTNAFYLDEHKIEFFKANNVILNISLDGDQYSQEKNKKNIISYQKIMLLKKHLENYACVNFVVSPLTVENFFDNFLHVIKLGFNFLNILPAAYFFWSDKDLNFFEECMERVLDYISKNNNIFLKNDSTYTKLPLFNDDFFVDYDGDLFLNNLFLYNKFSKYRESIKQANILNIASLFDFEYKEIDYQKIFLDEKQKDKIIKSTCQSFNQINL